MVGQDEHVMYKQGEKPAKSIGLNELEFTELEEVEVIISRPKREPVSDVKKVEKTKKYGITDLKSKIGLDVPYSKRKKRHSHKQSTIDA